jgi:chlorobactene glucosyltransferase
VTVPPAPILWSLPWALPPIVAMLRALHSRNLDEFAADVADPPLVSVIIPARNEATNIARCVRSVLASQYPALEVIVVDDHSTDGTGDIARSAAAGDSRTVILDNPDLPAGWFGKQWACENGAKVARGRILVFTDADTEHAPDLLGRVVNAMRARRADLLTLAGNQEMHTFWERVIQPQMFALLSMRYGGTEHVSNARRPTDVIANGQFIAVDRDAYEAVGGHALVRDRVAEDMSMAQAFVRSGRRMALFIATNQFSTRMYSSLGEIVRGWRKNVYAGGRHAALGGDVGRALYPFLLLATPIVGLAPPIALVLGLASVLSAAWLVWSAIVVAVTLGFWIAIYAFMRAPVSYALLYPLGLAMLLYIAAGAVARGRNVEWKDRKYEAV